MAPKKVYSHRLDPVLMEQVEAYARDHGWVEHQRDSARPGGDHGGRDTGRSGLLTYLLEALVEGRLVVHPRAGNNPFPADEIEAGTELHPITITR